MFKNKAILKDNFFMSLLFILFSCVLFTNGCESEREKHEISLFDGKALGQWEISDFVRHGDVYVKDGAIYIEKSKTGGYMTGITWTGPLVQMNYEITLEAMRIDGSDFFCGLTFPVGDRP